MFFGKSEPEKVSSDALDQMLDPLLEKKLGNLDARAGAIIKELRRLKMEFERACDKLQELDAAPYTEGIWQPNINSIKNNKIAYTRALKQVMTGTTLELGDATTSYYQYKQVLSEVDETTNEILRINATFKPTLYSYSNHLDGFKRTFSSIERQREELRRVLDGKSREANEYTTLKEHISKLDMQKEELETLENSANAIKDSLDSKATAVNEKDIEILSKDLAARRSELSKISAEASELSSRISLLTLPLERPAKKFDHVSGKKRQLSGFVADPINRIRDKEEYSEFVSMLGELRESIEKGATDVKNKEESIGAISKLLNTDIVGMVNSLKSAQDKRSGVMGDIKTLESAINDIQKGHASYEQLHHDIETIEEKIMHVNAERERTKGEIEKLFSSSYKKQISIIMQK